MSTKAGEMFDAWYRHSALEGEMEDALQNACGVDPDDYENNPIGCVTFDHYDNSFEFKAVKGDWAPTPEQLAACFALGFSRCWICYKDLDGASGAKKVSVHYGKYRESYFEAPSIQRVFPGEPAA